MSTLLLSPVLALLFDSATITLEGEGLGYTLRRYLDRTL